MILVRGFTVGGGLDPMCDRVPVKRALISVSNKAGIEELARALVKLNCEIFATGGTKRLLDQSGLVSQEISRLTGNPEAFGGRMKTISFEIESALLFDRQTDRHEAEKLGIEPIDLVVCNLYPFQEAKEAEADLSTLMENIDIGGPTMIRAGAKNFSYVAVVTDPEDYQWIIKELEENDGCLTKATRTSLMRKAFNHTADYDSVIATTMDDRAGEPSIRFAFQSGRSLRYGENAHQSATFYRLRNASSSLHDINVRHGKELSFNNIVDISSALETVRNLRRSGCAIIKHTNPCGLAEGEDQREVFEAAWQGDPLSAFGSVIAFNKTVDAETVRFLRLDSADKSKRKFVEVISGPRISAEAFEYLSLHKNLRIVEVDPNCLDRQRDLKIVDDALLVQDADTVLSEDPVVVTDVQPVFDRALLEFGMIAVRQLKSNAIAAVRRLPTGTFQLLGMGAGQPNRVTSTELTLNKCRENLRREFTGSEGDFDQWCAEEMGRILVISDAFFPFPDSIDLCADHGVKTVVQPGGSMRDKSVIGRCNERRLGMVFVGMRHFKH
jgi:phosphoribosylaminoimidazolecarboxamide formyltransferase/IMP cyclohydrolase